MYLRSGVIARVDVCAAWQRLVPLAEFTLDDEDEASVSTASTIISVEKNYSTSELCELIERDVHQFDKSYVGSLNVNKKFELHYCVLVEPSFTMCVFVLSKIFPTNQSSNHIRDVFDALRSLYLSRGEVLSEISKSEEYGLQSRLHPEIYKILIDFNGRMSQPNGRDQKVSELRSQVDEVKTVMSENVMRVMERGERLENLDNRAEALQQSSQTFKTTARRVQRHMCFKNLKWTIILTIFISLLVILGIVLILKTAGVI